MTPLSSDEQARAKQLANLQPGAGAIRPGERRAVKHGLRSRPGSFEVMASDAYKLLLDQIEEVLPRGSDGLPHPGDLLQAEAVAHQGSLLFSARLWRSNNPEATLAGISTESIVAERYSRGLERLGIGPSARAKLGLDVLRAVDLASAMSEPDPDRRAALMADAGVELDATDDVIDDGEGVGDAS